MNQQAVTDAVTPAAEASGLEVDRIEFAAAGKRAVVRVYLDGDGPEGHGPSLDEIADATRAISKALDEAPGIGDQPYLLEVSSRGATRPLTEAKHYRRNTGRLVALTLAEGGKVTGRIVEAGADGVRIDVDGAEREVPYAAITKAVVQVELKAMPDADADDADDELDEADAADEEE